LKVSHGKYSTLKKRSLFLISVFYIVAGINHFWHPKTYLDLIPQYLPAPIFLNFLSGVVEIISGLLILIPSTRKAAAYIIIAMLIAFIPAHIYLIQQNGCVSNRLCVPDWIAWVRLFPLQFILMWWAWKTYKWNTNKLATVPV
jgi:uncharacterized membrane protein